MNHTITQIRELSDMMPERYNYGEAASFYENYAVFFRRGIVMLLDMSDGKLNSYGLAPEKKTPEYLLVHGSGYIVIRHRDETLEAIQIGTGKRVSYSDSKVHGVFRCGEGRLVVHDSDGWMTILDIATMETLAKCPNRVRDISSCVYCPIRNRLFVVDGFGRPFVWTCGSDASCENLVYNLGGGLSFINPVKLLGSNIIAYEKKDVIVLIDIENPKHVRTIEIQTERGNMSTRSSPQREANSSLSLLETAYAYTKHLREKWCRYAPYLEKTYQK